MSRTLSAMVVPLCCGSGNSRSGGRAGAAGDRAPVPVVAAAEPASLGNGIAFVLAEHPDEAELVAEGVLRDRPVDARFLSGEGAGPRVDGRAPLEPPADRLDLL